MDSELFATAANGGSSPMLTNDAPWTKVGFREIAVQIDANDVLEETA
ncbi:hypothetical protein [Tateyamaria sp.]